MKKDRIHNNLLRGYKCKCGSNEIIKETVKTIYEHRWLMALSSTSSSSIEIIGIDQPNEESSMYRCQSCFKVIARDLRTLRLKLIKGKI